MEAKEYLKNKIIVENCKIYLEILQFLPHYEALVELIESFDLEAMTATQNFITTKNKTTIIYKLQSYRDVKIEGYVWHGPVNFLDVEVELKKSKITSIKLSFGKPFLEEFISIDFLNNKVSEVVRDYKEKGFGKRNCTCYISDKVVNSIIYDMSFNNPKVEYKMFVENSYEQGGNCWTEIFNERNYSENTCTSEDWVEVKDISHNQFDKRFEGNLKRVRRFGRMPENSKY